MSREFEIKLRVPDAQWAEVQAHLHEHPLTVHTLEAHYFDSADAALQQRQASLRLRREDDRWVQTLKIGGDGAVDRFEHSVALDAAGGHLPVPDLGRHRDEPDARRLIDRVEKSGPLALQGVAVVRTQRSAATVDLAGGSVEVAVDEVQTGSGTPQAAWREIEFESKTGSPDLVFRIAEEWLQRHPGLWIDAVAKGARARRLAEGQPTGPVVKGAEPELDDGDSGEVLLQAMVRACLVQMLGNAGEVALGSQEAEHVHQLRVGIRRLRTALRELGELSERADPGWEDPLREVLQALGQSRDRQVLAAEIEPQLQRQNAPLTTLPPPTDTPPLPADVVRRPDFQRTLLRMMAFVETAGGQDDRPGVAPARLIRRRLSRLHRRIVAQAQDFQHLPLEEQHHERKRLKRLRYLAELVAPLYGGRRTRRYLEALKPAQDLLGQHNDEAVALAEFERLAPTDPRAWFAVGWLRARLEGSARTGQAALQAIDRADRFWRR